MFGPHLIVRLAAAAMVALLGGIAAGCSSSGRAAAGEEVRRTRSVPSCATVACKGELGGAPYELRLPESWNGTLLLFSHGYRPVAPAPPDFAPVDEEPKVAPSDGSADALLREGYALIGSAYSSNGWAYAEGVRAGEQLHDWFRANVAAPDRVYVWGESLGGLITQGLAEKHPDWVSGAAPLCGVLGGLNLNLDLALDLAYAVRQLFHPRMKLVNYVSRDEALTAFTDAQKQLMAATSDPRASLPKLLALQAILDAPTKTSRFDGRTPTAQASAVVESVLVGLFYGTVGRFDIEQRVGGNPSGNAFADYPSRVTSAERALADAVAPGGLDAALRALAAGERVTADPRARRLAHTLGEPTGVLRDPTITLHTAYDPLVLVQNQSVFADRVTEAEGRTADLVQLYTQPPDAYSNPAPYGAGHCNFTDGERTAVITLLDAWVTRDEFPSRSAVERAIVGANGYAPDFTPGQWPAYATP